jgi:hypothetical protein
MPRISQLLIKELSLVIRLLSISSLIILPESGNQAYYREDTILGGNKDVRQLLSGIDQDDPDTDIHTLKNSFDRLRVRVSILDHELDSEHLISVESYLPERNTAETNRKAKGTGEVDIEGEIDLTDPTETDQNTDAADNTENTDSYDEEIDYLQQIVFTNPELVERELEMVEYQITEDFYRLCEKLYQRLGIGSYEENSDELLKLDLSQLVQGVKDYNNRDLEHLARRFLSSEEQDDLRNYLRVFELSGDMKNEVQSTIGITPEVMNIEEFDRLIDDERYSGPSVPENIDKDFSEMSAQQILQEFNFRIDSLGGKGDVKSGFRELIKRHHPDQGGDKKRFEAVKAARNSIRSEVDI